MRGRCDARARVAGLVVVALAIGFGCSRSGDRAPAHPPNLTEALRARSGTPAAEARACAPCHGDVVAAWEGSQHADANRLVTPSRDADAFHQARLADGKGLVRAVGAHKDMPFFTVAPESNRTERHFPEMVIGLEPLRQYLVPFPGGRWQAVDLAYDPAAKEWFNAQDPVWGPQDWGHWRHRGMNWNSQCASCHMTELVKGYDPDADAYQTTWRAMGISCAQCHGPLDAHAASPQDSALVPRLSPERIMESCASCHARREELTGAFRSGDRFDDHYRLMLPDLPGLYYPDGKVREEDFEYGSFRLSRMGHKGVQCLDCHDPHSGKLKVPVEANELCATCHAAPGQRKAAVVDFATHSHHAPQSPGNRCVECHMPVTRYMVRDPRRDHGFTIPDPLLTQELGIPNACTQCHGERPVDWAVTWTEKWYGSRMDRPSRGRARAIARAQAGDPDVLLRLIDLLAREEIPAWRATLVALLTPWADQSEAAQAVRESLDDPDPLVRAAAARVLGTAPADPALIARLQQDSVRVVRIEAAWTALRQELPVDQREEVLGYLRLGADQPAGALRMAQLALAERRSQDAESWARKATAWDPSSSETRAVLGSVLHAVGKTEDAALALEESIAIDPDRAESRFTLALLYGELGREAEMIPQLERAVALSPEFARAWYNLGLVYAQQGRRDDALFALDRAAALMPESGEALFARATLLVQFGDVDGAERALHLAIQRDPSHAEAARLLRDLEAAARP